MSEKIMTLDILSNIKGAKESKVINQFFDNLKKVKNLNLSVDNNIKTVSIDDLRKDEVAKTSESEIELIKKNFPQEKNGFLVVSKVIED